MNKISFILLLFVIPIILRGTPQEPERLVYKSDSVWIDYYPLEVLREKNPEIDGVLDTLFLRQYSTNRRGYTGTWQIINDSLFLVKLESDKFGKAINLEKVFDRSRIIKNRVFAYWYSSNLAAQYGELLGHTNDFMFEPVYTGSFSCKIVTGIVSNIKINYKSNREIDLLKKRFQTERDTMVCLVVNEYPKLIANERTYDISELNQFISQQILKSEKKFGCTEKIYFSVLVEKDGTVSRIQNIRPSNNLNCDKAALRIAELMTKWIPGKENGRIVRTKIMITFWDR